MSYKEGKMKLSKSLFRTAYNHMLEGWDLMNANQDYEDYLRTGEVPKYVQDFVKAEEEKTRFYR